MRVAGAQTRGGATRVGVATRRRKNRGRDRGDDVATDVGAVGIARGRWRGGVRGRMRVRGERDAAPEPTEDEYRNAVGEATQTLERAFGEINDALEELRYEFEEVRLDASNDG